MLNLGFPQQSEPISLTQDCRTVMLAHCHRKLTGENYLPGEDHDKKAFGLLGGVIGPSGIKTVACFPLLHNARQNSLHKTYMDEMMEAHAIPSETPLSERGWVAAAEELARILKSCRDLDLILIGTYHMHRVAWPNDKLRDTPTALDTILGKNSRLLMFIVSLVNPTKPLIRAFYEGDMNLELPIHYI